MIPLDRAFRWVLASHEVAQDVCADQRQGQAPGDLLLPDGPPRVGATGPRLASCGVPAVMPMRISAGAQRGPPRRPPPRMVPLVPDMEELSSLLEDSVASPAETTGAEQRLCQAHGWLFSALRDGRLRAWAHASIRRADSCAWRGPPVGDPAPEDSGDYPMGRREIPPEDWGVCAVDYQAATAASWEDDREEPALDGYRHRGHLVLERVTLDPKALGKLLKCAGPGQRDAPEQDDARAVLRTMAADGGGEWTVTWAGEACPIDVAGSILASRGMRAIAVLLRLPGVKVSHYLLEGLDRKLGHGGQKDIQKNKERDEIQRRVDPLGQRLFEHPESVDAVHEELGEVLKQVLKDPHIGVKATWSAQFNKSTTLKRSPDGKRVAEKVRESVDAALKKIEDSAGEAHKEAASSLRDAVEHDKYSSWYKKGQRSVTWSAAGPSLSANAGPGSAEEDPAN